MEKMLINENIQIIFCLQILLKKTILLKLHLLGYKVAFLFIY